METTTQVVFLEPRSSCDTRVDLLLYSNAVLPGRMLTLHDRHLSRTDAPQQVRGSIPLVGTWAVDREEWGVWLFFVLPATLLTGVRPRVPVGDRVPSCSSGDPPTSKTPLPRQCPDALPYGSPRRYAGGLASGSPQRVWEAHAGTSKPVSGSQSEIAAGKASVVPVERRAGFGGSGSGLHVHGHAELRMLRVQGQAAKFVTVQGMGSSFARWASGQAGWGCGFSGVVTPGRSRAPSNGAGP
ncbi:hypothetical protein HD596_003671 [Nonomuraea jabiensis]|uniref:Uncharacterized protein n=1 Tax=Nonomuraea jabiensis TaxID=882448 RepID=A0A7W9G457_9ACTN|nr:hypothetical protein [Nonomuraea jabiensis]